MDNEVIKLFEKRDSPLRAIFPLTSNSNNIKNVAFKYGYNLMRFGETIDINYLIEFEGCYSVIRVYRDIFLAYDENTESWVLIYTIQEGICKNWDEKKWNRRK